MLDPNFFDNLEYVARQIKKESHPKFEFLPFGGIQVILCGDFFQLPPIQRQKKQKFLFESNCWRYVIGVNCFELTTIFRQAGDPKFVNILNEMRKGQLSFQSLHELDKCVNKELNSEDGIVPTTLYATKDLVTRENSKYLEQLEGELMTFKANDKEKVKGGIDSLNKSCTALSELGLKVGAQVILLKNLSFERGLVNGTRGTVIDFDKSESGTIYPLVKFSNKQIELIQAEWWSITIGNLEVATREQLPLDLAWAMSIHKSQGMTIDRLKVDIANTFAAGQAYVALSRATSLEGLSIIGKINPKSIFTNPAVLEWDKKNEKNRTSRRGSFQGFSFFKKIEKKKKKKKKKVLCVDTTASNSRI
eukprot:TRINITY_DN17009_c0_g1_i4.p1 TRINITY_DN17009_c0_g1~~TRINITY_DN17009_c0_g1_i4.p1  ORF type:complete len:362 (-),score=85.50 TRINITY_DN17009_c0_g1_i4:8-1093(-)